MKDMLIVIVILLIGAGWFFFVGHSHAVKLRYDCGIEVPWHEAFFLETTICPGERTSQS
ncbi:hypothetical protein [Rhabdochromatium marinum]|uniref:hypothetical protein n=1 Tax=Rhabdochromatium marinum TaxID=48729 RepID=UPI0019066D18|nr:hypothetical protein [Rhabdochromatium marinum]